MVKIDPHIVQNWQKFVQKCPKSVQKMSKSSQKMSKSSKKTSKSSSKVFKTIQNQPKTLHTAKTVGYTFKIILLKCKPTGHEVPRWQNYRKYSVQRCFCQKGVSQTFREHSEAAAIKLFQLQLESVLAILRQNSVFQQSTTRRLYKL